MYVYIYICIRCTNIIIIFVKSVFNLNQLSLSDIQTEQSITRFGIVLRILWINSMTICIRNVFDKNSIIYVTWI